MKTQYRLLMITCFFILAGCSLVAPEPEPTSAPEPAPNAEPVDVQPTSAASDEGYPAAEDAVPTPTASNLEIPESYPAEGEADSGYPSPPVESEPEACAPELPTPQRLEFLSGDLTLLVGTFYPAASCNAPVVVLFHQYQSDKESWIDLALWLQNRDSEQSSKNNGVLASPAMYPWFPAMPDGMSFNVFAFDFRGHGESANHDGNFDAIGYIRDSQMAITFAKTLPHVSQSQIITIGASIGADASVDACLLLEGTEISDFQQNQGCIGTLSLSPGNYLGLDYADVVTRMSDPPFKTQVYCVSSELDGDSPAICSNALPGSFSSIIYPDRGDHGIALLQEDLDPDIGSLILEFLLKTLTFQ